MPGQRWSSPANTPSPMWFRSNANAAAGFVFVCRGARVTSTMTIHTTTAADFIRRTSAAMSIIPTFQFTIHGAVAGVTLGTGTANQSGKRKSGPVLIVAKGDAKKCR